MKTTTILLLTLSTLSIIGCSFWAKAPMDVLTYTAAIHPKNRNLFVFLRGIGSSHVSFEKEGMVAEVRARELPFDMIAPNAHFSYYSGRTLTKRLREDVILPARQKGYRKIWLVGVSMGGLGSLLYLREHPEDISGIYLIAPFVGYNSTMEKIINQGGVRKWYPGLYDPEDDWQTMLWDWLKQEVAENKTAPIYLGYGDGDRYVFGQQLLAEILPSDHVTMIKGQHDYVTFKILWKSFLQSRVFVDS